MSLPSFAACFRAIHGDAPFPWQERLAADVLGHGWPALLDLPTGVGKTAALDVALYALAADPDRHARRVVLVVDRRLVVDQAAERARTILDALAVGATPEARAYADRLRALWSAPAGAAPFAVAVLRGGMPRDDDWARRPDQPLLAVSTVDQIGSRLLFRGYGVGPRMYPVHAGLLGHDTRYLLDEVHLARPFADTLGAIASRYRGAGGPLPERWGVTRMSATPGPEGSPVAPFRLTDEDRAFAPLAVRLGARKLASLRLVKVRGDDEARNRTALAEEAVSAARELQVGGASVVAIVVNRVATARAAWAKLREAHAAGTDALLVTGRMRALDRDALTAASLLPRVRAGRARSEAVRPLVVVATQCIEAGADFDFDGLVTECASFDALNQRLGRLDRRGALGQSRAIVLARSDEVSGKKSDPIYGYALAATWAWLQSLAEPDVLALDLGIAAGHEAPLDCLAPRSRAPVLLPAHLDAWAQTAPPPAVEPEVAAWLHGPDAGPGEVQIVWRGDLPPEVFAEPGVAPAWARERLAACRPSALEALSLPIWAARAWLSAAPGAAPDVGDVIGAAAPTLDGRRGRDDEPRRALRWAQDDSEIIEPDAIRPGDVLVVPSVYGGLSAGNWDPTSPAPVRDHGDLAQLRGRGRCVVRLHAGTREAWGLPPEVGAPPVIDREDPDEDGTAAVREWLQRWPADPPPGFGGTTAEWASVRAALDGAAREPVVQREAWAAWIPERPPVATGDAVTEDDDSPFTGAEVPLAQHCAAVRACVERWARSLSMPAAIAADLAAAAGLHDVGKADPRFQRWLRGGLPAPPGAPLIAKSRLGEGRPRARELARRRAGYPRGERHELVSLALLEGAPSDAHDPELVAHLVASHHGWCRPFAPPADHASDLEVEFAHGERVLRGPARHGAARLDSGVSERFWMLVERYGWWGLAWLEAILRLADHRVSEREASS